MIFIVHNYAAMLPVMRGSLTEVLLAVRDPDDAAEWARVMVDGQVREKSVLLRQHEFLRKRKHQACRVPKHTPAEIERDTCAVRQGLTMRKNLLP